MPPFIGRSATVRQTARMKSRSLMLIILAVVLLAVAAYAAGGHGFLRRLGTMIHG